MNNWEKIQTKTFTKWVNTQLNLEEYPSIQNLFTELQDGTVLLQLLEIISEELVGKFHLKPKHRLQKIENLNLALKFIRSKQITLTNIGAEDIADSNPKLILGLIWSIILKFTINDINQDGLGAKEGLLLWCQRKTTGYKGVEIKNFDLSWQSGLAFCALIHHHYPDLINYKELNISDRHANCELAFDIAEKHLGIPRLLDIEDVCDTVVPDDRSIMTYVAQYFHAFEEMGRIDNTAKRVVQFVDLLNSTVEYKNEFEKRASKFVSRLDELNNTWFAILDKLSSFSYAEVLQRLNLIAKFQDKFNLLDEKLKLFNLFTNIQSKLQTYNLPPYSPPSSLSLSNLDHLWSNLLKSQKNLVTDLEKRKKELKKELGIKFNNYHNIVKDKLGELVCLFQHDSDINSLLELCTTALRNVDSLDKEMDQMQGIVNLFHENTKRRTQYLEMKQELELEKNIIIRNLEEKKLFVENQLVARKSNSLSIEQMEEIESAFRHFDQSKSNKLTPNEFRACLAALGSLFSDEEFDQIFQRVSEGSTSIGFDQFVSFVRYLMVDQTSREKLEESFQLISDNKPYITELDLKRFNLPSTTILSLSKLANPNELDSDSLDYSTFLNRIFS